ncbi:MAG: DUF948 domain-containing protein [Lactobacillales bacterium]|jgi:uncharacterized protein YoxC|nr:DUF948 domain-containing protein [Lactobacillales bacterium]
MTGGEIALLIIAGAVVLLVLSFIFLLQKIGKTVDSVNRVINRVNQEADVLFHQVDILLTKTNTLVEDVNEKLETIDPLFTAIADLSESVSELNTQGRKLASSVTASAKITKKIASMTMIGQQILKFFTKKEKASSDPFEK